MGPPWAIREGGVDDRPTLQRFHRALYQEHRDAVLPEAVEPLVAYRDFDQVLEEDVNALLRSSRAFVQLAEAGGELIGYITGHIEEDRRRLHSTKGVVEDWYVVPAYRSKGVGSDLMRSLEAEFRKAGCTVIESNTWTSDERARRAHDSSGFLEVQVMYRKLL